MDPFDAVSKLAGMASNIYPKIHDSVEDWNNPASVSNDISKVSEQVVEFLNRVPGMTQAHSRDFKRATPIFTLRDGSVLKTWKNPVGVNHVFIANKKGEMVFGGFVGWIHAEGLHQALQQIRAKFT
ncbi:hypothetical protein RIF25_04750 [Thermosynechococcaceae cyanobacterium BACA0444]|uniref:Uncharacterized protein n=1 Tax=Pseudocalidococcus azoricus BACA0444 TaxID=2918990 RepID=A0AAE4FR30_9CYAN|nr:hypothetical protein [Pseudocalidococcus azoricus]MDS3860109.1 hypothetical protein [Pseudocalidococcus azoricus BACA0444]